jgi:hypothetical protein
MGLLDDARRLKEIHRANPHLTRQELQQMLESDKQQAHADDFAPNAVKPYIEVVPPKIYKANLNAFVANYIGIVGLQPEDVFAIYPAPDWGPLSIVYRDRPEYQDGRRRYRRAVLGE